MIKGLKKLFIGLLIGLPISFVSYSYASWQEFDIGLVEEIIANSNLGHSFELLPNANFLLNDNYKIIQFAGNNTYPSTWTYFWNGSGMYVINTCVGGYSCDGSIRGQGYFNFINIVDLDYITNDISNVPEGFTPISDFLENPIYNNPDKLYIGGYENMQTASLCFGYSDINKAVCFTFNRSNWNNCGGQPQYCTNGQLSYITNSQGYTSQDLEYLSSFATNSPFVGGSVIDNTPISYEITTGDYVDYYESTFNFNSDMCYVGTRDLSGLYEDRLTYYQGSGYTIFDTFSKLYNTNSYRITDIGGFLGAWYSNYSNWFNGGDHSVIYQYEYGESTLPIRGTELTNPFLNNKAVYYFIGSTFYLSHQTYSETYDVGLNVAFYCFNKLNDKSNDGSTYDITDDHGYTIDRKVLGDKRYQEAVNGYYSGASEIVGVNFDGSPLDYFSSGKTYFDTPGQWFDSTFNKFKVSYGQMNPSDLGLGYLPSYIILFFCALVIFRFMSH